MWMNKSLLRKIKHEGIPEVFQEGRVHSDIISEYLFNKVYPDLSKMSNNELFTYLEEVLDWSWRILPSISPQFNYMNPFSYSASEYWNIMDEIDDRYDSYYHHRHEEDY